MTTGPTPEQVAAQVVMIYRRRPEARVIGIHTPGAWLGGPTLQVNGVTLPVVFCTSALQVSDALVAQAADGPPLVVVTTLDDRQLSLDVLARFAGRQLYRVDRWQMVRDLFRARHLDPRLAAHDWLADALLQHIPEEGYAPVASGVLDADTVWTHLLAQYLGLSSGRSDAVALVSWSTHAQNLHRYDTLPVAFRAALRQRVEDTAGAVGAAMLDALEAGHGALLLPIGVVCEMLFAPDGRKQMSLAQARARLEPYVGRRALSSAVGHAWFAASASVLASLPETAARDWLDRAYTLLADLKATEHSALSTVLVAGFHQRLAQFATELQRFLRGKAAIEELEVRVDAIASHKEAARQTARLQRVDMALRLARYLRTGQPTAKPTSLAQAAAAYAEHGGYVDWARRYLSGGDETEELARAFGMLTEHVRQVREQQNQQFASLLADWHKTPKAVEGLLPIEQALSRFVARLVRSTPVLLMVIDGMSYAVFRELCDDLRRQGWVELTDQPGRPMPLLVSTVPSVTGMSRTSLLSGKLTRGNSATEKRSFVAHAEVLAASRAGYLPLLFHKGELVEAGATGLAGAVREAIRDGKRKVVGVVLNAVDDHLAKADQLRLSWTIEQLHHLDTLLYEAHLAQRAVLVTSDHGHVLEAGTVRLPGEAEDRWRPFSGAPADTEVVFEGPRVEQLTGVRRIIVPWSETVRYGQKKQGYHGGATPQEVLVPLAVLSRGRHIKGWEALPESKPAWWSRAEIALEEAPTVVARPMRRPKKPVAVQGSFFADMAAHSAEATQADWVDRLLGSAVFAVQRRMAGRIAPDNSIVQAFLQALDAHHGRMARRLLAQMLGQPDVRLRGLLPGLQRLLNVEGYQIITVDESSGMITLDHQLLEKQFQL
jgi:hypothetical protein